jgi:benzoyl-CoA-dihydrodiol lyase
VQNRADEFAQGTDRPADAKGIELVPLARDITDDAIAYDHLSIAIDRKARTATLTVKAPTAPVAADIAAIHTAGADFWPLAIARQLDDAILHLRANEPELGTWVLRCEGDADLVAGADAALKAHGDDWLVREIVLFLKRVLKRLDVTSRSLIALIEPGSCFTGTLLELALAADRSYMLDGALEGDNRPPPALRPTVMNFGAYPMPNGLSRLATRFLNEPDRVAAVEAKVGEDIDAIEAEELGLVTFAPDDIDWEDEIRIAIEERASFSPDALTGMEASLRFAGPETLETKIFGRLSAWQNWIFQRPNAVGEDGALKLFGTGKQAKFDAGRV